MQDTKQKILVVDDDSVISEIIQEALQQGGFETVLAENGKEALDAIETEKPDAIILDRRMPVMDGNETLRHIRANKETKDLPVLMLTGDHDISQVMESLELGANEYIVKPIAPEDMVVRLKVVLETGGVKRKDKKDFEGFEGKSSGW